ncbi:hypothetical protein SEMRO_975_G226860.1 [Seminavis robusta]|uniref:Uncharacterized protein n=1 Tax=Seminavis robusta TaxID=568900 RepID=A0A9N8ECK4_9STRA|nr:hypothetical protein SEMRO_975_G226860.1 [Seminavis robusta]|eukprot:Sro975_g226860.1 n/a (330) ;mRNA; f:33929-34918
MLLMMIFKHNVTGSVQRALDIYDSFDLSAVHEHLYPVRSTLAQQIKKFSYDVENGTVAIQAWKHGYELLPLQSVFPMAIIHYNKHFSGKVVRTKRAEELAGHMRSSKIGISGRKGILGCLVRYKPHLQDQTNAQASAKRQTNGLLTGPSIHQIAPQNPTTCREPSGANDDHMFQLKEALLGCHPAKLFLVAASKDPKELDEIEKIAKELIACVKTTKAMLGVSEDNKTEASKSLNSGQKHVTGSENRDAGKDKASELQETRPDKKHASLGENTEDDKKQATKQHQDRRDKDEKVPDAKNSTTSHQTTHHVVTENESNGSESNDAVIQPP